MKHILAFAMLLALVASLSGCNLPTQIASNEPTSVPSFTNQPGGGTPYPPPGQPPTATIPGSPSSTPIPPPTASATPGTPTVPPSQPPTATIPGQPSPTSVPPPTASAVPDTPTPTDTPVASGAISLTALKNFTYTVESSDLKIPLKDGVYEGDHVHSELRAAAFGDLNGDGAEDAVVVLSTNTGGSGSFYDLVAVLDQNGTPTEASYAYIGDRQVIKHLQIANGRVVLDYMTQGPNDGLCCPSQHRLRSYLLDNNVLRLASEQVLDSPDAQATPLPDAILIDQPSLYDKVTTPLHVSGRVSQVPPEKKLEYAVTDRQVALLDHGEVELTGEPGGPGTFSFDLTLGSVPIGGVRLELIDSANGILRGRSQVELLSP